MVYRSGALSVAVSLREKFTHNLMKLCRLTKLLKQSEPCFLVGFSLSFCLPVCWDLGKPGGNEVGSCILGFTNFLVAS